MIVALLEQLSATAVSRMIRQNAMIFPWLEVLHVIAITLVLGTILLVDLRLIGAASTGLRVSYLSRRVLPITWIAFALAAGSGTMLFLSQPLAYYNNISFRLKMAVLIAAATNMTIFHLYTQRDIHRWDTDASPPMAAKLAGVLSITCWIVIAGAARWIGFTLTRF